MDWGALAGLPVDFVKLPRMKQELSRVRIFAHEKDSRDALCSEC